MKSARAQGMPKVQRLGALRRVVRDLEASVAFYRHGLGFRVVSGPDLPALRGIVVLALGAERIELVAAQASVHWPAPADAPAVRFQHVAVVASDMERAYDQLQSVVPVPISRGGPQQLPAASGGVRAFKFRDPDGHPLELIEFPAGTGAKRWQIAARQNGSPTLGLDHSAICVANVEQSIAFYQQIGFTLGARQRNRGPEQSRLDGLDLAEVDVVALLPADRSSPHLELLGYQSPPLQAGGRAGKPSSADVQVTLDRLVWQVAEQAAPAGAAGHDTADRAGLLVDPDGHLNEFVPTAGSTPSDEPLGRQ